MGRLRRADRATTAGKIKIKMAPSMVSPTGTAGIASVGGGASWTNKTVRTGKASRTGAGPEPKGGPRKAPPKGPNENCDANTNTSSGMDKPDQEPQ